MASLSGVWNVQDFSDSGAPLVSGRLYTYVYGTTTQKTAYTDAAGSVAHTYTSDGAGGQYIALNARGELPAPLYLTAGSYDLLLKRADGSTVWTRRADPISADFADSDGSSRIGHISTGAGSVATTVQTVLREGRLSVMRFGAVANGTASGGTDNAAAFNACAVECRATGKVMYIPEGSFRTGTVDRTGVYVEGEGQYKTNIYGQPGLDVFYWKGSGETGALRCDHHSTKKLTVYLDASIDARANFLRVSMGGHRVGNCAFFMAGGNFGFTQSPLYKIFDEVAVRRNDTGAIALNGSCGLFMSEPINGLELPRFEVNGPSYGIIEGISDKFATNKFFLQILTYDVIGDTFTKTAHGYANTNQLALIYDTNLGTFNNLLPRTRYYVVGATADTFQLSLTSGGAAIDFSIATGTPVVYSVRAGASSIEYAPDVRSFQTVICKTGEAGLVLANGAEGSLGKIEAQSSRVCAHLLNFPGLIASDGHYNIINDLYVEGPLDSTWGAGKEYWHIEWNYCTFNAGPNLRGFAGSNSIAEISGSYNKFNAVALSLSRTLTISGSANELTTEAQGKEVQYVLTGAGNRLKFAKNGAGGDGGTLGRFAPYLAKTSQSKNLGGFWPDYLKFNSAAPFRGEGTLFYPATDQRYQAPPADIVSLFDDATLDVDGYTRSPTGGSLSVRNPLGSNTNKINADQFFPRSRFRLYFKLRAIAGTPNVTLNIQKTSGTTFAASSAVVTLSTAWTVYSVDVDASLASSDAGVDISVQAATGGFDLAYFYLMPWTNESLVTTVNYGGGVIDAVGTGSPEGVLTASVGSTYRRRDGGANTSHYIKESGTAAIGWIGK